MKVAIVGERDSKIYNLNEVIPENTSEVLSGGARGIDICAKEYAISGGIKYSGFLTDYKKFGKSAPLKRNMEILAYADMVIAFRNGQAKGTRFVIDNCRKPGKILKLQNRCFNICIHKYPKDISGIQAFFGSFSK
ncbi:MAG: hypothetical protein IJ491_00990 [Clostridia bacterium]|nr:hypothetical protein [Clostridia bacterium]